MTRTALLLLLLGCGSPEAPPRPEPPATVEPAPDAGQPTGFPCDVRAVLQTHCASCHVGHVYVSPFASRADLHEARDGRPLGQLAVERMNDAQRPMPPRGAGPAMPTAEERAIVERWVTEGMPAGSCAALSSP